MLTFWTDLIYLAISGSVALWVGWTLHKNGRVFLIEVYQGKEDLADSINHLILVSFYLVSIGFVAVAIRIAGTGPHDISGAIQLVSTKVGLVLGVTHFRPGAWCDAFYEPLDVFQDAVARPAGGTPRTGPAWSSTGAAGVFDFRPGR